MQEHRHGCILPFELEVGLERGARIAALAQ